MAGVKVQCLETGRPLLGTYWVTHHRGVVSGQEQDGQGGREGGGIVDTIRGRRAQTVK